MSWDYQYHLPQELIAQTPANPRDSSRLMSINKTTGEITHHTFRDLPALLDIRDVLVFNDTKVIPARLYGTKSTGGKVEILLLRRLNPSDWEFISHPGLKAGQIVNINSDFSIQIISPKILKLKTKNLKLLDLYGHTPLPPYIHSRETESTLRQQYQTIYAKNDGSAAAPTAGLHFTKDLLAKCQMQNIQMEYLTLHVGLGTFKTPTPQQIAAGKLHSEPYTLDTDTATHLNTAKLSHRRIIAVGTTTTRVLESCASPLLTPKSGETDIFIKPPDKLKFVDGMITNFHLPGTSLLMLISSLASPEIIKHAYEVAIKEKYRFYSFGDSCLII